MRKLTQKLCFWGLAVLLLLQADCIFVHNRVEWLDRQEIAAAKSYAVKSATKAHLFDGSLIVFAKGFEFRDSALYGKGVHWNLHRTQSSPVSSVRLDSVASLERYKREMEPGPFLSSIPGVYAATVVALVAIFGSCPTIYTFENDHAVLEAETFSYSISEKFETEDLDRLDHGREINGEYTLELRNEALETHYINQMSLLCVDHAAGFQAFPNEKREVVLFGAEAPITNAVSKSGLDVSHLVASRDDLFYQSDTALTRQLTRELTRDWLDLNVSAPAGAQKMCVALRLRNTLMNTVLLYDIMYRSQGLAAVDWMGVHSTNPIYAWRFASWYREHFGLRVQLLDGETATDEIRIGDTGPIAWHEQATVFEAPASGTARLRLSFLPDNWAIDWVGVSFDVGEILQKQEVACDEIRDPQGLEKNRYRSYLEEPDDAYLLTYPGEHYLLRFRPTPASADVQRSYFLRSRGYYIEWLRHEWLQQGLTGPPLQKFELNDASIFRTAALWLEKKDDFEAQFYATKIPVGRAAR